MQSVLMRMDALARYGAELTENFISLMQELMASYEAREDITAMHLERTSEARAAFANLARGFLETAQSAASQSTQTPYAAAHGSQIHGEAVRVASTNRAKSQVPTPFANGTGTHTVQPSEHGQTGNVDATTSTVTTTATTTSTTTPDTSPGSDTTVGPKRRLRSSTQCNTTKDANKKPRIESLEPTEITVVDVRGETGKREYAIQYKGLENTVVWTTLRDAAPLERKTITRYNKTGSKMRRQLGQ